MGTMRRLEVRIRCRPQAHEVWTCCSPDAAASDHPSSNAPDGDRDRPDPESVRVIGAAAGKQRENTAAVAPKRGAAGRSGDVAARLGRGRRHASAPLLRFCRPRPAPVAPHCGVAARVRCGGRDLSAAGGYPVGDIAGATRRFQLILIKPSHYHDDGYVIRWWRALIPSNSLASIYGLARDCAARQVLGADVAIDIEVIDETNTRVDIPRLLRRFRRHYDFDMVRMVGVWWYRY